MSRMILHLTLYLLEGVLIALGFTALILWLNLANLRHLMLETADGPFALAVFVALCSLTFGAAQMGLRFLLSDREK